MIDAVEALRLPSAQLTRDELLRADRLELEIEACVRVNMTRQGAVDFKTNEASNDVIAEVNQRLKRARFNTVWTMLVEESKVTRKQRHVGWTLNLAPTDEAYREHARERSNGTAEIDRAS